MSEITGKWLQSIDIFISSPSDVAEEREAILRVIERLNRLSSIRNRYTLKPLMYEHEVPPEAGDDAQMIVDRYMAAENSYLLICLMWNRMGTPFKHPQTGEEFQSGTEYEFMVGYRANRRSGQPHLLLYRKIVDVSDPDEEQKEKVEGFFKQFEGSEATLKGLYKQFSSLDEFESMLFDHIERILYKNPPREKKIDTQGDPDSFPSLKYTWSVIGVTVLIIMVLFISYINARLNPLTLYFVVDTTFQMDTKYEAVTEEIQSILLTQFDNVQVGLRIFGNEQLENGVCPSPSSQQLIAVNQYTNISAQFNEQISGITPFGYGSITSAIFQAVTHDLSEVNGNIKLIVITSNIDPYCDSSGGGTLQNITDAIVDTNPNIDLVILSIGEISTSTETILNNVAESFGGVHSQIVDVDELANTIQGISFYDGSYLANYSGN